MGAADDDGAVGLGRQLGDAVDRRNGHGDSLGDVHIRACEGAIVPATMPDSAAHRVDNKVTVLILQHPQEQDHVLGTAGCCAARWPMPSSRSACRGAISAMRWASRWRRGTGACSISARRMPPGRGRWSRVDRKGETAGQPGCAWRCRPQGLVVLDGNWAQAKALWWRNAWLTKLRRFVVVPDGPSLYGSLRKEARPDAVSTLEAVALALSALEEDPNVREKLLAPFRELIAKARAAGVQGGKRDRRRRR